MTISSALLVSSLVTLVTALVLAGALGVARAALALQATGEGSATVRWHAPSLPIVHLGCALAAAFLVAALIGRTLITGHAPWSNMYEATQAFALAVLAAYLALERRHAIRPLAAPVAVLAAALVAYALALPDRVQPLVPALQQPVLLTVHVGSALAAYGLYAVAFAGAAAELVQRRAGGTLRWLPDRDALAAVTHRAAVLGFPILTAAIALGALWANLAWRSYWSNDPKELAAAATWLVYAAYLHAAGRRDRWGRAAPWLLVGGFAAIGFTFFGVNLLIPGEHSYSGL